MISYRLRQFSLDAQSVPDVYQNQCANTLILLRLEFVCSIFTHSSCVLSLHILLQGQYMKHKNTFIPMKCLERQTCTELMGENQDFFTFNRIQNMYFYIFRNEAIIFHTGKDDIMDSHNNFIMPNVNIRVNKSKFPLLLNNRRINFAELNKLFESNLQRHREFNDDSAWNDFYK